MKKTPGLRILLIKSPILHLAEEFPTKKASNTLFLLHLANAVNATAAAMFVYVVSSLLLNNVMFDVITYEKISLSGGT